MAQGPWASLLRAQHMTFLHLPGSGCGGAGPSPSPHRGVLRLHRGRGPPAQRRRGVPHRQPQPPLPPAPRACKPRPAPGPPAHRVSVGAARGGLPPRPHCESREAGATARGRKGAPGSSAARAGGPASAPCGAAGGAASGGGAGKGGRGSCGANLHDAQDGEGGGEEGRDQHHAKDVVEHAAELRPLVLPHHPARAPMALVDALTPNTMRKISISSATLRFAFWAGKK